MKAPKMSARKLVHVNPFSKVFHVEADFDSFIKQYYITHFGPRAGLVAVRNEKILLVRQYRLLPNCPTLEIPGGRVEKNETPEEAIVRECLEETGVIAKNLKTLVKYYPGLDNVDNETYLFYTETVEENGSFQPESREVVEVLWVPLDECLQRIYQGKLLDALTIVGILAYHGKLTGNILRE